MDGNGTKTAAGAAADDGAGGEAIVIDAGTGTTKAGFSGEDSPRSVFHTVVGLQALRGEDTGGFGDQKGMPGVNFVVGEPALAQRETLSLVFPVDKGEITEWDAMERLWEWTFHQELDVDPEADNLPVLLTDVPRNSRKKREQMTKIMFETFRVKGFYIAPQAVLSLFASGRTSGMVLEAGEGVSHAVPVFEGYALRHAVLRSQVAGDALTKHLTTLLSTKGYKFSKKQQPLVRSIKEKHCYVALNYHSALAKNVRNQEHELPDGQVIAIDHQSRVSCTEALFDPAMLGDQQYANQSGLSDLTFDSINQCDLDLQKTLYSQIVIAGGTSMFHGFADRLAKDVTARANGTQARVHPDSQRKFASWIGGSMLASLSTFGHIKITKQEYDDCHEAIVHRKCF